ncbi:hypothetical protein [Desulfonatronum thioautotrophicum]|uniref:hypothetical protein n=1 Tax=Desulfonatronum thioautotrophicum TaxID=617001 RepID=UPI0005EB31B5|nr:hypothetical protein [Desulfonatronum thioautotrophicum]
MPDIKPGNVLLIDKRHLHNIDHHKFAICICISSNRFLYINSNPSRFAAPETQVQILGSAELPFLTHVSYVDVANVHELPRKAVVFAIENGNIRGNISKNLRDRIKAAAIQAITLTTVDREMILNLL